MIVCKHIIDLQERLAQMRSKGKSIGFVPTMGALHRGHLSLIEASRSQNDVTVCSIFVNPTQFNDSNDFDKYPVTIENDILQLENHATNLLFLPPVSEIYPDPSMPPEQYPLGDLETILEGKYRPGHFQGVCQVVSHLFNIVQPDRAYFGQKDYQQCMVIKKLISLLHLPVEMVIHSIVRETSGLAMSSRNMRLTARQKEQATVIFEALCFIKENRYKTDLFSLQAQAAGMLRSQGFESIDYITIADATTLTSLATIDTETRAVTLIAATIGEIRLIDNLLL